MFNPEMLILARGARRLSQAELARESQTSQGDISKAENGNRVPSSEIVERWATALGFEPEFFSKTPPPPASLTFYRKAATMPARDKAAVDANVRLRSLEIETLARSIDLPEPTIPTVTVTERMGPEEIAGHVRELWRLPRGPIRDLTTVVEDHGIIVAPIDFNADKVHGLSVSHLGPPILFVRRDDPVDRWRFTMAHELGHMVMHHHREMPTEDIEAEADAFASALLMPAADVRGSFRSSLRIEDLAQLKMVWRVSMQSLLMRAKALGRITESHSKRLWQQLSARGYRLSEPVALAHETPTLLSEILSVHRDELGYSDADLARALSLKLTEFQCMYCPSRGGLRLVRGTQGALAPVAGEPSSDSGSVFRPR